MTLDRKELQKLNPEQRLKKLKEYEENRLSELKETLDLIKRTEAEVKSKTELPSEPLAPDPVDISKIFEPEAGIEKTVADSPKQEEKAKGIDYTPSQTYERESEVQYGASEQFVKTKTIAKFDNTVNYQSEQDKLAEGSASRSVLSNIKKYTRG